MRRDHEQDQSRSGQSRGGSLLSMFNASVSLGTWLGVELRAHATLILLAVVAMLMAGSAGKAGLPFAAGALGMLFVALVLHEAGHCLAARSYGGHTRQIMLGPLGGLSDQRVPPEPLPTFMTALAGPLVNLAVCALSGSAVWAIHGQNALSLHPLRMTAWNQQAMPLWSVSWILWLAFLVNFALLVLNLLPLCPLDGWRMLHAALWPRQGFARAWNTATATAIATAGGLIVVGLALRNWLPILVGVACVLQGIQHRRALAAMGEVEPGDLLLYGRAEEAPPRHRRRGSLWRRLSSARARRMARLEQQQQAQIDRILAKVSAQGLESLTWKERRALHRETQRQRRHDLEMRGRG